MPVRWVARCGRGYGVIDRPSWHDRYPVASQFGAEEIHRQPLMEAPSLPCPYWRMMLRGRKPALT
jgi:hypothetical protein